MSGESENLTLIFLRRLEAKLDRVIEDVSDLKRRMTSLEIQVGNLNATMSIHYANTMLRMDAIDGRLDRIERRLEFADA